MDEQGAISIIEEIIGSSISSYSVEIISRKAESLREMKVTLAVICKKGNVTHAFVRDFFKYSLANPDTLMLSETSRDLRELEFEVLLLEATIEYM